MRLVLESAVLESVVTRSKACPKHTPAPSTPAPSVTLSLNSLVNSFCIRCVQLLLDVSLRFLAAGEAK